MSPMHKRNISNMHTFPVQGQGMDIIIVSTENVLQEKYWEKRLRASRGLIVKPTARICCVTEDWPGGAGNGLGTLYAYVKAKEKLARENVDLCERLLQGASVALYHTAGVGKRLFPLTPSEYGNKTAIKLPSFSGGNFLTVLEGVIKQTGIFSSVRKGRLSVFWGDQIFIPSLPIETRSKSHIDILAIVNKLSSESDWEQRKLSNYGLIVLDRQGKAKDIEKTSYQSVKKLIADKKIALDGGAGISLGDFSLSAEMLFALLDEFSNELSAKNDKMDSDPYFWMPLTLDFETYLEALHERDTPITIPKEHYLRMQNFKQRFIKEFGNNIFGAADVGANTFWWDYGTIQSYMHNNLKICKEDAEAEAMKAFLQIDGPISHSRIRLARTHNSVIMGVNADELRVSDSIILHSNFNSLETSNSLLYNVVEDMPQTYSKGTVRSDTFIPSTAEHIKMFTTKERDGKADWKAKLADNPYSYEELFDLVRVVDPLAAEKYIDTAYKAYREGS